MEMLIKSNNMMEAWGVAKRWYPRPNRELMAETTRKFKELYTKEQPLGLPIPVHFPTATVLDEVPMQAEIAQAVRGLKNGKAPGQSKVKANTLKRW
jgi:hypothetical protein